MGKKWASFFILSCVSGAFVSCAPNQNPKLEEMTAKAAQSLSCKESYFSQAFWDTLKRYVFQEGRHPEKSEFKEVLQRQIEKNLAVSLNRLERKALSKNIDSLLATIFDEATQGESVQTNAQLLQLWSALDVGDRSTEFRNYLQNKIQKQMHMIRNTVIDKLGDCVQEHLFNETSAVPSNPQFENRRQAAIQKGESLAVLGGHWATATAYQSCQSLQLPPVNEQTSEVQGIRIVGVHPDGVGNKRVIGDIALVQSTHYYIRDQISFDKNCFDVRANPLIYDYGGKPAVSGINKDVLDLFKNDGDGTSVLGIDCSAFVYSSLATGGLRLQKGRKLQAIDSWAWGSSAYVEPQKNGLTCLDKITLSAESSIRAGDVVAVYGHVILIDRVGIDPFGLRQIQKEADCEKLNSDQFDFVVAQSSPSKGGLGINFFEAAPYLKTNNKMRIGLEKYAVEACHAQFSGKKVKPNLGQISIVRHSGTPDCFAARVPLAHESCIENCASLSL